MQENELKNDNPLVFYAYIRISPTEIRGNTSEEKQKEADDRLNLQKKDIRLFLSTKYPNAKIKWYEDKLISGRSLKQRVAFNQMLLDCRTIKPYSIIFTKISRFARSARDLLNTIHELGELNVQVMASNDQCNTTTPEGRAWITIAGAFAELEAEWINQRTGAGKKVKQEEMEAEGKNWGRPRHVVINKLTGSKMKLDVNKVKDMRSKGYTIREIASTMNVGITPIWSIINNKHKNLSKDDLK